MGVNGGHAGGQVALGKCATITPAMPLRPASVHAPAAVPPAPGPLCDDGRDDAPASETLSSGVGSKATMQAAIETLAGLRR
jgi:hypothetical protein